MFTNREMLIMTLQFVKVEKSMASSFYIFLLILESVPGISHSNYKLNFPKASSNLEF